MGIFDAFRKKKDDLDLGEFGGNFGGAPQGQNQQDPFASQPSGFEDPMGMPPDQQAQPMGFGSMQPQQQQQPAHQSQPFSPEEFGFEKSPPGQSQRQGSSFNQNLSEINLGKDMEIISAKLDAIKAELDSMNQRLKRMERLAEGSEHHNKDPWQY